MESSNDGYLAVGGYEDWNDETYPLVMRISDDGDVEWSDNTYFDHIYRRGVTCMEDSNGNYAICGWSNTNYTHTNESNIYLCKYSEVIDNDIVINDILPFEPTTQNYIIEIFENQDVHFEVDAYDPDGNDLNYTWLINQNVNLLGHDYFYDFNIPNTYAGEIYTVRLVISDGSPSENTLVYYWEIHILYGIATPENLKISIINDNIQITWNEVPEAIRYNIYESDNPDGTFIKIDEVIGSTNTIWTTPITDEKKFYLVKSSNI